MDEWKLICYNTYRLNVEGGWLYRYNNSLCFAPSLAPATPKREPALLPVVPHGFGPRVETIDIESEEIPDNHVNGTKVETLMRKS